MMLSKASWRLAGDHDAIDQVLKELKAALETGDVETSHAKLDLFWARLAVHIRAEHLHLFPAIVTGTRERTSDHASGPLLCEAMAAVDQLRNDHNFFMHELADAIQAIRKLGKFSDKRIDLEGLNTVQNIVGEIERRLLNHNQLEEQQVYRWAGVVLSEQRQAELATRIERELANRPPRFSAETWQHS
jgi:hemerythrin superfamily protein